MQKHKVLILDLIHRINKIHAGTLICKGPSVGGECGIKR